MQAELLARHPARPASEVEWEDLLARLELMPRALRVLLEAPGVDPAAVALLLRDLIARELFVRAFLERASGFEAPFTAGLATAQPLDDNEDALDRFVRLRARNFAMVQRRGIDVWEWQAPTDGGRRATLYQVLSLLAREDVTALAAVRAFARTGASVC